MSRVTNSGLSGSLSFSTNSPVPGRSFNPEQTKMVGHP